MTDPQTKAVVQVSAGRLPYAAEFQERYGVDKVQWRALIDAVFPNAPDLDSVILALSYCKARNLDVFKKPVHIVPMWNSAAGRMVTTVWPGIGELLTTAARTGVFAGRDAAIFGPTVESEIGTIKIRHPEWCEVVVYRMVAGHRVAFHGPRVYWLETYASKKHNDATPNAMWTKRPFGQIEKCALAGAVRVAFPEEVGNEYAAEEMEGKVLEGQFERIAQTAPSIAPKPAKDKIAEFAKEEADEPAAPPPDEDAKALTEALSLIAAVKNAKGLSIARKHAIPLMGRLDTEWPEGKDQITLALAEAEERIAAQAATAGTGADEKAGAPAPVPHAKEGVSNA